jgi:hypothetical protein
MAPPDVMLGAWKLIRQENFDEYLFTLGSGHMTRAMSDPETWLTKVEKVEDDVFKLTVQTTVKKAECVFRLDGHPIEEITGDGRKCKTVMAWDEENSMLVQMREGLDGCKGGLLIKKFDGDDMEAFYEVDDVLARRVYKRDPTKKV